MKKTLHSEKRSTHRAKQEALAFESAIIQSDTQLLVAEVVDYSPFGLGLLVKKNEAGHAMSRGDKVTIQIMRNGQKIEVRAVLATQAEKTLQDITYFRLGFELLKEDSNVRHVRQGKRFYIDTQVVLEASCDDPSRRGEEARFKVKDFSKHGLLLDTSARNKFLLPQMKLNIVIKIPGKENFVQAVTVRHIQASRERYLVGCSFDALSDKTLEAMVLYYLSQSQKSKLEDETIGFKVGIEDLTSESSNLPVEIMQIADLRLVQSLSDQGKVVSLDPWRMLNAKDQNAQHVSIKYGKRVVACARVHHFPRTRNGQGTIDDSYMELSQVAVDPDFRLGPAYLKLWSAIILLGQSTGSPYLIWTDRSTTLTSPLPQKLGILTSFRRNQQLEIVHLGNLFQGRTTSLMAWSCVVAPLIEHKSRGQDIPAGLNFKLTLSRLLRKLFLGDFIRMSQLVGSFSGQPRVVSEEDQDEGREAIARSA